MLAGRRFKLREPVIATTLENTGKRVVTLVPTSSVIEIVSGTASGLRILDVLWDGHVFAMFASDIEERGDELRDKTAEPRPPRAEDHAGRQAEKRDGRLFLSCDNVA